MERFGEVLTRAWIALVGVVAAVLVEVVPAAGGSTSMASDLVVFSLAALALACALRFSGRSVAVSLSCALVAPARGMDDVPVLAGRVTDPVHHPLAPRAPGLV